MTMEGHYSLAWQKGSFANFAEVSVNVEKGMMPGYSVEIECDISSSWSNGVLTGADFFYECLLEKGPSLAIQVRVVEVIGQVVDTPREALAFVTFHAIKEALGVRLKRKAEFNEEEGTFSF